MKKRKLLLGLAALLLPLTSWAADDGLKVTVTPANSAETIVYAGDDTPSKFEVKVTFGDTELQTGQYTIFYTQTATGDEQVNVRNAGTYTAHALITSAVDGLKIGDQATENFTVDKLQLTSLVTKAGTKTYGDTEIDLSQFVQSVGALAKNEAADGTAEETANALKCLYVYRVDQETVKEEANNTYRILVRAYAKDADTGSNYYYVEGAGNIDAQMTIAPKELTVKIDGDAESVYTGEVQEVAAKVDGVVEGDNVSVAFDKDVTGTNSANTTLLNADTYTLTAVLSGDDAKNYTLADDGEVTYKINRAELTIEAKADAKLTKVYDGKYVDDGNNDLTEQFDIKIGDEDANIEGLSLKVYTDGDGKTRGKVVGAHLVGVVMTVDGKENWISNKNYETPTVSGLENYSISFDYADSKNKYRVTKRPVNYWFTSDGKKYDAEEVTSLVKDTDYKLAFGEGEDEGLLEDDELETEPTAKFAEVDEETPTVKDAGSYALVVETQAALNEDIAGNYELNFVNEAEGETINAYVITQATAGVNVKHQTLEFGKLVFDEDGNLSEDIQKLWRSGNTYTDIALDNNIKGANRSTDANLIRSMLTFSIINENAKTGESGEYEEAIQANIDATKEDWSDDQKTILKNYSFTYNKAKLTISDVSEELVLDGAEDATSGEFDGESILEKLTRLNGATVSTVKIKNLKNFIADTGFGPTNVIKKEQWYTLILPFDVTVKELSDMFGYAIVNIPNTTNTDPNKILFKLTMQTVPANTLMAFKVAEDTDWNGLEMTFETSKKIVAPTSDWATDNAGNKFIGVYEKTIITDEQDWIIKPWDGNFWPASNAQKLGEDGFEVYPLNGYVHFDQPATEGIARTIGLENPDGTTSIVSATTDRVLGNNAEGWYTVGGIKLNGEPTQKGIYINNGKKVVIK